MKIKCSRLLGAAIVSAALLSACLGGNSTQSKDTGETRSSQNNGGPNAPSMPPPGDDLGATIAADEIGPRFWNADKCVTTPWTDVAGNPLALDDKFGAGTKDITRCLAQTEKVRVVYQINAFCEDTACTKPYALSNILNQITDYEVTHGMKSGDYEIVLIVHSAGWKFVLDPAKAHPNAADNVFAATIVDLVKRPNVKVLFCQNTANSNKVQLAHMIDGVGFVTAGVSALADLQEVGYQYVQP